MTRANLKLVDQAEEPLDITLALRADIQQRDWARVMIEGDRRPPIFLPDAVRRLWRR
jgi:hypothetical protein